VHAVRRLSTAALALLLAGCVFVPRTAQVYDERCGIQTRQLVLELQQVGVFGGCANDGCVALLVAAGVVTAASAVLSGSVVVAGNIVYWFERRGACPL
jgi:acyl transferase domain-containing protein